MPDIRLSPTSNCRFDAMRVILDEGQKAPYNLAKRLQNETDTPIDELHPKGREHEP
jgi:hypothetical protein